MTDKEIAIRIKIALKRQERRLNPNSTLFNAFHWVNTIEGYNFWRKLWDTRFSRINLYNFIYTKESESNFINMDYFI